MDEILWLLQLALRDLEAARRRSGSKKVRASIFAARSLARESKVSGVLSLSIDVTDRTRSRPA